MVIGVLKEKRVSEFRVALLPVGAYTLTRLGHRILVETGAGDGSGFPDTDFQESGAEIMHSAEAIYGLADMILKVKEPLPEEYDLLRASQIIFTFFHFAASETLTRAVLRSNCIAIAYETIETTTGHLPLLTPMSEVAGLMAVQEGAKYLARNHGGSGVLISGVPGVAPANVVVIGGGVVGANAARLAAGMGAQVKILDTSLDRLRYLNKVMPANVVTLMSNMHNIRNLLPTADLVVSGVLIHGAQSPQLITRSMLRTMKQGSVIVDVAIDQGGSLETSRPTNHDNPIYMEEGVIHYCVTNMPGAMPVTSTIALTNATLPYVTILAEHGYRQAILSNLEIRNGANIVQGHITYRKVAEAFKLPFMPVEKVLFETHENLSS